MIYGSWNQGKIALVTASSTGIGKAVAEALAEEGCKLAICARSKEVLIETSHYIKNKFNIEPFWGVAI